ncbi:DUF4158 domain-containing protein [Streptomyces sp. NPDC048430]|uniref:DUF4158 domain-containing protein n=1 Tax=Streptomyces sp. NPDC048430 TaxID=3155388 RepID=UPI0034317314
MPVEFLTDDQAEAYGKFAEEPTRPELERFFFFLDDIDRDLIALRRTKHHQLGFALQMCTVRYVGLFLEDPLVVPWPVVEHLAVQLGVEDPSCVKRYTERRQTLYDHAWEIRDAYGYHPYDYPEWGRKFRTFLHGRARRIRFHDLRHSTATLLLEQGVELVVIKELLGHAHIGVTATVYAHVRIRLQRDAIDLLGHALGCP